MNNKKEVQALYREKNRAKINAYSTARRMRWKQTILDRYGNQCAICGFNDMRALQLDHINDNGSQERKDLGSQKFSGVKFYEYLIKQGLPDGYQILCANCNNIKQWNKNKAEPKRIELSSQA